MIRGLNFQVPVGVNRGNNPRLVPGAVIEVITSVMVQRASQRQRGRRSETRDGPLHVVTVGDLKVLLRAKSLARLGNCQLARKLGMMSARHLVPDFAV